MKKFLYLLSFTFFPYAVVAAPLSDIHSPDSRVVIVRSEDQLSRRHAMVGLGAIYQSQDNLESRMGFNASLRWLASERWYLLAEYQYAPFNETAVVKDGIRYLQDNESATVAAAGVGFSLMQGSGSFTGRKSYPWQLAAEMFAGEQFTGDTSGRYTALGFSWQIIERDYWVAMGWRIYQTNDERLSKLDVNSGAQWGVSFGSWF